MITRRTAIALPAALAAQTKSHVVFVTGDDEYRSEYSMPALAKILETRHGCRTSIAYARPTPQTPDNIEGLEALASADLAVFYLRWRRLPEPQLSPILRYVESGKPLAGFRTSTHSFKYPAGHPQEKLNDGFGRDVFGQRWIRHHGHLSTTEVSVATGQEKHPVLSGVQGGFVAPSWLYVLEPFEPGVTPLLTGKAINPQNGKDYGPQAVAWTKSYKGARVFFTTLGHPGDFRIESVRKLAINGILWALGRRIPSSGADAAFTGPYDPPPDGIR